MLLPVFADGNDALPQRLGRMERRLGVAAVHAEESRGSGTGEMKRGTAPTTRTRRRSWCSSTSPGRWAWCRRSCSGGIGDADKCRVDGAGLETCGQVGHVQRTRGRGEDPFTPQQQHPRQRLLPGDRVVGLFVQSQQQLPTDPLGIPMPGTTGLAPSAQCVGGYRSATTSTDPCEVSSTDHPLADSAAGSARAPAGSSGVHGDGPDSWLRSPRVTDRCQA